MIWTVVLRVVAALRRPGHRRRLRRQVFTAVLTAAALTVGALLARFALGLRTAIGASARISAQAAGTSAQFDGQHFRNVEPTEVLLRGSGPKMARAMLGRLRHGPAGHPPGVIPVVRPAPSGAAAALAVTWFGHASALIEVDGARVLADPVWGERVSPSERIGPARLHPPPLPLEELPRVDAIVISHDHYDHLDLPTVRTLLRTQDAPFYVPLGIGAHLRRWKVPEERIVELDWDQRTAAAGGLTLVCAQTRHFSGRGLTRNTTLWCSWVIGGPEHRVYFGGDTGYGPFFADLGRAHGPFDVTLLPIGAYNPQWAQIHLDPEEAIQAHQDLGGTVLVPIHWATFDLAFHAWAEPPERLLTAARAAGVDIRVPRPGERVVIERESSRPSVDVDQWWTSLA